MAQPKQSGVNRFYLLLGVLAVAGVAVLAYLAAGGGTVSIPANVQVLAADTAGFRGYLVGSPDAPVEITEYADYQCPACEAFATVQWPTIKQRLIDTGRLRWRFRDFPLDQIHPSARLAAHSVACADEQGRFLEQNDRIYATQTQWTRSGAERTFRRIAEELGLDLGAYDECMRSARYAGRIQASQEEGVRLGVNGTPTFLANGRLYSQGFNYDEIRRLVDSVTAATPTP